MVAESGLFNPEVYGQGPRWQGQIADDSGWRDNIQPGKFENSTTTQGWGRRYKVRIMGLHDKEEETISSDQLPWAQVEFPITAGGGQAGASATPNLRQGMFVYGYFQDGPEQQVPIITGVLGHNATTELKQKIGDTDSNFAPTSGYAEGKVPKTFRTKEVVPKYDQVTAKPKTASVQNDVETADSVGKGLLNQFGLRKDLTATAEQLKDIASAQSQADALGLLGQAREIFVKSKVHQELRNRVKRANSPISPPVPGATCESADAPHRLNAGQVQREDKYREKIVVSKPDEPVQSAMKSMQTILDNVTNKIDKFQKAIQNDGYIDMVSMKNPMGDLEKDIEGASEEMSKYMKVVMDKMMEFVNKTTNSELTTAVSAMPSSMRFMFADMKELTGETTHKMYLGITNDMGSTIGPILRESLNIGNILDTAKQRALNIDLDINLPLPKIAGNISDAIGVLDSVKSNIDLPLIKSIGKISPPGVIGGSGTKDDPWISPAVEAQGDLPLIDPVLSLPAPLAEKIPPLSDWIQRFGSKEGKLKYQEAKKGISTTIQPMVLQSQPTLEEFENKLIDNANSDGIADLSISTRKEVTSPSVPMCYAEDVVGKVIYANKKLIDEANQAVMDNMNEFIGDMQSMIAGEPIPQASTNSLLPGAIIGITDEEVLDQVRGGTNYLTAQKVPTTVFKNINAGITTSPGSGCEVDITVTTGGLAGYNQFSAQHFTWISQGTNYVNGNQGGVICDTNGDGTGMVINMTVTGGTIQSIRVHTIGSGYKVGDEIYPHMQGGSGSIAGNGSFKLDMVAGAVDPNGIKIAKNGGNYQVGDVLKIVGGGFDASFTVTSSNDPGDGEKATKKKSKSLAGLLNKLSGIQGNLSKALNFENVKTNIFPFELPPNPAVSDFYQLVRGGASQAESQMPSLEALAANVNKLQEVPNPKEMLSFIKPTAGQPDINRLASLAGDAIDDVTSAVDTVTDTIEDVTDTLGIG